MMLVNLFLFNIISLLSEAVESIAIEFILLDHYLLNCYFKDFLFNLWVGKFNFIINYLVPELLKFKEYYFIFLILKIRANYLFIQLIIRFIFLIIEFFENFL